MRVQAGIALTHGVAPDFRGADLHRITVADSKVPQARLKLQEIHPKGAVRATGRTRELAAWVHAANPLDPFVHRALFQFWRSCALMQAGFSEEAISALDGVVAVAAEAAHLWLKLPAQPSRREVGDHLSMSREDQGKLELLYGLRCAFGAHPAHSKWWDFDELYDDELEQFPDLVRRLLQKFLCLEVQYRTVDPDPSSWGAWFLRNSELLLDAVWFTKLPAVSLTVAAGRISPRM